MQLIQLESKRAASVLPLLLILGSLTACALGGPQPRITQEKDLTIGFGSGLFDLVELDSAALDGTPGEGQVRVTMYSVTPVPGQEQFSDSVFDRTLRSQGAGLTWERIVRVRENGDQVWVFAGMDMAAQRLHAVCVFTLEEAEPEADDDLAKSSGDAATSIAKPMPLSA